MIKQNGYTIGSKMGRKFEQKIKGKKKMLVKAYAGHESQLQLPKEEASDSS